MSSISSRAAEAAAAAAAAAAARDGFLRQQPALRYRSRTNIYLVQVLSLPCHVSINYIVAGRDPGEECVLTGMPFSGGGCVSAGMSLTGIHMRAGILLEAVSHFEFQWNRIIHEDQKD